MLSFVFVTHKKSIFVVLRAVNELIDSQNQINFSEDFITFWICFNNVLSKTSLPKSFLSCFCISVSFLRSSSWLVARGGAHALSLARISCLSCASIGYGCVYYAIMYRQPTFLIQKLLSYLVYFSLRFYVRQTLHCSSLIFNRTPNWYPLHHWLCCHVIQSPQGFAKRAAWLRD